MEAVRYLTNKLHTYTLSIIGKGKFASNKKYTPKQSALTISVI
jgi:hypothetical protein